MNAKEIKILLIQKGLSITEIARALEGQSEATFRSLETMVRETLYGIRYYPSIAEQINDKFGIQIDRPDHLKPVKEQIKQVA